MILNVQVTVDRPSSDKRDRLWNVPKKRSLQVIMTPYRDGTHLATKPKSFLKIIKDLATLHEMGFVHGDIRGFNTVFHLNGEGCLIDFDFGGKAGMAQYPNGYRLDLRDGKRRCDLNSRIIQKWHDWYALGRLIFEVYDIMPPDEAPGEDWKKLKKLDKAWESQCEDPSSDKIEDLKDFLTSIDNAGWRVEPKGSYGDELKRVDGLPKSGMEGTNPRATGSPPKG